MTVMQDTGPVSSIYFGEQGVSIGDLGSQDFTHVATV
jgi:hypothetical protein